MSNNEVIGQLPKRLKIYLWVVLVIFITGYFSLIILEKMTFIDAFYFLVVTIATVGYGDITPHSDLTKLIVSILIIVSISSIALLSEQIVSRIVSINTRAYLELPKTPLNYRDHIIICGFTNIAENITSLFQARFFRVIILDPHEVAIQRARRLGLEAYLTIPYRRATLEIVNINQAMGLYLFMDDENHNVLTSIQARGMAENLLIYASTEHELSIELGNLIGIDRTYHYERIAASNIRFSLRKWAAFSLPNQLLSENAQFFVIIVTKEYDYLSRFSHSIPVGYLDETLTHFISIDECDQSTESMLSTNWNLLIAVTREEIKKEFTEKIGSTPIVYEASQSIDTIIIGGYNNTARHIIKELDYDIISDHNFKILCFSANEANHAKQEGYDVILIHREELEHSIKDLCQHSTMMINLFDQLTDSLLLNTVIRQTDLDIFIIQLAHNQIETDVLIKSGVNRILIPDMLMSRGMFLILLNTKKLMNSIVWSNIHIFEHYIDDDSPLKGKNTTDLHKLGYYILLYKSKLGTLKQHSPEIQLGLGDSVLLYREHSIVRQIDQLVDATHN